MRILKSLLRRKISFLGAVLFLMLLVMAVFAPFLAPYDPQSIDPPKRLLPPGLDHWFGTDHYGRDILSRVIGGSRLTMFTSLSIVLFSLGVGVALGMVSGFYIQVGKILMRFVDCLMAFPAIMLALALLAILGPGLINVIVAVSIVYGTKTARIMHGLALKLREEPYVEAARGIGMKSIHIFGRCILLNALSPIIVQGTFTFAFSVLTVASLDFLGVGAPPHLPSWGADISLSRVYITRAPWTMIFPGFFIAMAGLSLNLVGDALRDELDPQLRDIF